MKEQLAEKDLQFDYEKKKAHIKEAVRQLSRITHKSTAVLWSKLYSILKYEYKIDVYKRKLASMYNNPGVQDKALFEFVKNCEIKQLELSISKLYAIYGYSYTYF